MHQLRKHVTKFTTFIIKQLVNKANSIDLTGGEQYRYFIYIDDVVSAFLVILENINNLLAGNHLQALGTTPFDAFKDNIWVIIALLIGITI